MENATTRILQSKFFSPIFNTAIFDGPIRVYFSQQQEPEALKVYFSMQSYTFEENDLLNALKERLPSGKTIFVMIYPNQETFRRSFDQKSDSLDISESWAFENLGEDYVIGLQGPISDKTKDDLLVHMHKTFL